MRPPQKIRSRINKMQKMVIMYEKLESLGKDHFLSLPKIYIMIYYHIKNHVIDCEVYKHFSSSIRILKVLKFFVSTSK